MDWQTQLKGNSLEWLLEKENPEVRYLALRDLLDRDEPELMLTAHKNGPIPLVLHSMNAQGYWEEPGPGYNPKYKSTVWALILLAQLGAKVAADERIHKACGYLVDHALTKDGQFSASGAPSGTADCLQGNLIWALLEMGFDDPRLEKAIEWMARTVTGEGLADSSERTAAARYFASKCGPNFACGANNRLPCAWGGTKVLMALGNWPIPRRTRLIENAIQQGVEFFLKLDPALAPFPTGYSEKPSQNWWKFGFPVFYVTDLLQVAEALTRLGYGQDPRLANLWTVIINKQDENGRWALEYEYIDKTWGDFGAKKKPNKWVTLRALRILKAASN